ncbi:MAG: amidase [Gammaproteobacteria bacterium]
MTIDAYEDYDGLGLAELVRRGEVSALELVDAAIARIERHNPALNAVVLPMYEHARELARGPLPDGPFRGVPFLLKDMTAHYRGFPTTHGSKFLADVAPSGYDSELVQRFRAAGLVTVGKTSTPELALSPTTEPSFRGPVHNPWDTSRTAGGSSGGSAAAIAARMVPIAHGGDGGGSLRIPASCCGIVGFKPSRMRTPHGPDAASIWESCCGEFVMSRSVRDSAALLDAVCGEDVGAYYASPPRGTPYADETRRDPPPLRIAWSATGPANYPTHPDCRAAVEHAARLCAELGHHVEEATPTLAEATLAALGEGFIGMLAVETAADLDELAALVGRPATAEDLEPVNWALAERGRACTARDAVRYKRQLHAVARAVGPFFERYDVYLAPTLGVPPVRLGHLDPKLGDLDEYFRRIFEFIPFTALFNVTGSPGVSLPLWWNDAQLPIGVQCVSRMGRDGVLFALAAQLERAQPWAARRPPLA